MSVAEPPADPDRYEEAVRALRRRVPMTDPEFRALEAEELKNAFWVAGVTEARAVQEIQDALVRAVEQGTTLDDFKADAGQRLAEAWGGEDAPRLETVFRTNVMGAYNAGRSEIFDDPDVQEARPYLRFDAVGDSRTSDICEAMDGKIYPADDPIWKTHTPPLHPNCRSIVTPLTAEEAGEEGVAKGRPDTEAAPADGFGRPAEREEEPDLDQFDDDIARVVREKLG